MSQATDFLSGYQFAFWDKPSSIEATIGDITKHGGKVIDMKTLAHIYSNNADDQRIFIVVSSDSYAHLSADIKRRYSNIILSIQWVGVCLHRHKVIPTEHFMLSNRTQLLLRSDQARQKKKKRGRTETHNNNTNHDYHHNNDAGNDIRAGTGHNTKSAANRSLILDDNGNSTTSSSSSSSSLTRTQPPLLPKLKRLNLRNMLQSVVRNDADGQANRQTSQSATPTTSSYTPSSQLSVNTSASSASASASPSTSLTMTLTVAQSAPYVLWYYLVIIYDHYSEAARCVFSLP
jgi:hypothetical protein